MNYISSGNNTPSQWISRKERVAGWRTVEAVPHIGADADAVHIRGGSLGLPPCRALLLADLPRRQLWWQCRNSAV